MFGDKRNECLTRCNVLREKFSVLEMGTRRYEPSTELRGFTAQRLPKAEQISRKQSKKQQPNNERLMLSNDCINDSQKSINSIMWRPHRSLR